MAEEEGFESAAERAAFEQRAAAEEPAPPVEPINLLQYGGDPLPLQGPILAIDHGSKRLGFAISTREQNLSAPIENYTRRNERLDLARIQELVADYRAVGLLIGLPLHSNGDESAQSHAARMFVAWVRARTSLPVLLWDERYSSTLADDWMIAAELTRKRQKNRRDTLAAHLILTSYLQARATQPDRHPPAGPT